MARVSQEELDRIIAGAGGDRLKHSTTVGKRKVENPDYIMRGGKSSDKEVELDIQQWVGPDGYQIQAVHMPDGSWEVIQNEPGTKPPTQTAQQKPAGGREGFEGSLSDSTKPQWVIRDAAGKEVWRRELEPGERLEWERQQNESRGLGRKTDKELADANEEASSQDAVPNRPGWIKITRKKGNDTKTVYKGPDGKEVESLPEDQDEATTQTAVTGRPGWVAITRKKGNDTKTTYKGPDGKEVDTLPEETKTGSKQFVHTDGKTYFEVSKTKGNVTSIYVTDSAGNRVTLPGKESKSVTQKRAPNGTVYYEVSVEKDNKTEKYTSSDPEGNTRIEPPSQSPMAGVKDVPSFTPDLRKPGAGLIDRQKQLDELYQAGKLTWEQRQAILAADIETAKVVTNEFNAGATILREQYQQGVQQRSQDMTQANSRAALANSHHQQAVGLIEKFAPYLGVTPGDAGKLFVGMMASQLATATMYGGMKDSPQVQMDPRLTAFADRAMGTATGAPGAVVPPGPGEAPAPAVAAPPNALGLGEVGAVPAPGAPPATAPAEAPVAPVAPAGPIYGDIQGQIVIERIDSPGTRITVPHATFGDEQLPGNGVTYTSKNWRIVGPAAAPAAAPLAAPAPPAEPQTDPQAFAMPPAAPGGANPAMEALFGKSLPQPTSWREDAENRMYAMTPPDPSRLAVGEGLFGASLPPWQQQAGPDYSLQMPRGGGGMDPIDAEARRQLQAEGILV